MSPAPERLEELAALCAAGAATASERAELESLAAGDPSVRDLMRGYADAASLLAFDLRPLAVPAGGLEGVRRRLATAAGGSLPGVPPPRMPGAGGDVVPLASRRRRPAVFAAVALPLAAAAAFAFLWWQGRGSEATLHRKVAELQTELQSEIRVRDRAEKQVAELKTKVEAAEGPLRRVSTPQLRLATVKSDKGQVVKILIDPLSGSWYLMAFDLAAPDPDKDYQAWLLDKKQGGKPVPSALVRPGPNGVMQAIIQVPAGVEAVGAAISLEPKGGSPTGSPTQVVMGGAL